MDDQPITPTSNQPEGSPSPFQTPMEPTPESFPEVPVGPIPNQAPKPKRSKKPLFLSLLILLLIAGAGYGVYAWQHKKVNDLNTQVASLQSQITGLNSQINDLKSAASSSSSTDPYAGWKTYNDKVISVKYPQDFEEKSIDCPPGAENVCISIKATKASDQGLIFYEKTSDLSAKNFATKNYASTGTTATSSNSDSINGYDTYTANTTQALAGKTYSFWETTMAHNGKVVYVNYPTNATDAATYKQIIRALNFIN